MLTRYLAAARAAMDPPWDAPRAGRVLERTLDTRRSRRHNPALWVLAFAGGSIAALCLDAVSGSVGRAPSTSGDPAPAAESMPADALDGGKQAG
jgi:hypothetical protein